MWFWHLPNDTDTPSGFAGRPEVLATQPKHAQMPQAHPLSLPPV